MFSYLTLVLLSFLMNDDLIWNRKKWVKILETGLSGSVYSIRTNLTVVLLKPVIGRILRINTLKCEGQQNTAIFLLSDLTTAKSCHSVHCHCVGV